MSGIRWYTYKNTEFASNSLTIISIRQQQLDSVYVS